MAVTDQITKIEKITMITKQQHKTLWFFVVIVVSAIGGTLLGQQQDVIRTGVTMVPIDVRAFDRQGRPVTNLKAEDASRAAGTRRPEGGCIRLRR
jgi:hypothetical protein